MRTAFAALIAALAVNALWFTHPVAAKTTAATAGAAVTVDRLAAIRERGVLRVGNGWL
ncbi:MAG: hypothetical protein ACREM6_13340 [Vulcanimicrobiaceae bacterium]